MKPCMTESCVPYRKAHRSNRRFSSGGVSVGASVSSAIQNGKKTVSDFTITAEHRRQTGLREIEGSDGGSVTLFCLWWRGVTTIDRRVFSTPRAY